MMAVRFFSSCVCLSGMNREPFLVLKGHGAFLAFKVGLIIRLFFKNIQTKFHAW
jgi:hypothetical protein